MKVEVLIDEKVQETEVKIICQKRTNEIDNLVDVINSHALTIIGRNENESFVLNLNDIYYFEAFENKVFAYLEKEVYEVSYKIAELSELLNKTSFLQTSRTIILNLNKINKIKLNKSKFCTFLLWILLITFLISM